MSTSEDPTLEVIEKLPEHDGRVHQYIFDVTSRLRPLIARGQRAWVRNDEETLKAIDHLYDKIRGQSGFPHSVRGYLKQKPDGGTEYTIVEAVAEIIMASRPELKKETVLRYMRGDARLGRRLSAVRGHAKHETNPRSKDSFQRV